MYSWLKLNLGFRIMAFLTVEKAPSHPRTKSALTSSGASRPGLEFETVSHDDGDTAFDRKARCFSSLGVVTPRQSYPWHFFYRFEETVSGTELA